MLTIYKASAGSGKTYNLALYYIKYLLGIKNKETGEWRLNFVPKSRSLEVNNQHRGILAITFTRKATEEMKQRIVSELKALAKQPAPGEKDANYADALTKELRCSRADLQTVAQNALQQLLFDYQNFHVSTIDSFFQKVLHTFAREIDIQADYQVEMNDKQAMQSAVGEMLDDFNASDERTANRAMWQLGKWLYGYMRQLMLEGKKSDFLNRNSQAHKSLVELMAQINKESFKPYKDDMQAYLKDDAIEKFGEVVKAYMGKILDEIKTDAIATINPPGDYIDLEKIIRYAKPRGFITDYFLTGRPVGELKDWSSSKAIKNLINPKEEYTVKDLNGETEEHLRAVKGLYERSYARYGVYYAMQTISDALVQLGLLRHAWKYLERLTVENNIVLISDTNELLSKVIGGSETPFVYERMGLQLVHHLIDEFQDTSKMQWDVLMPLVKIGVSEREDSMIIGDEKQSIYRFRNSDSSILHDGVENDFIDYEQDKKGNNTSENTNYRSSPDVVRFNNTLFSLLAASLKVPGFENVAQGIKKDFPGHIKFIATDSEAKDETILDEMVKEIRRLVEEGQYNYKDIVVLVDTNNQCARAVDYLVEKEIPVLSDEALFLYKSWAVQLVINTLRIIDREQSGETKSADEQEMRKYPTNAQVHNVMSEFEILLKDRKDSDDEQKYFDVLSKAAESLHTGATGAEIGDKIASIMARRPSSLAALVETVIEEQIPDEDARRTHSAYLAALQDAVIQFSTKSRSHGAGSLHAFLGWWDANPNLAIGGASEANAVKVMTIHKSKGLEFHCVLIPFCGWATAWKEGKPTPSIWTDTLRANYPAFKKTLDDCGLPPFDISLAPNALYVKIGLKTHLKSSPFYGDFIKERRMAVTDTLNKTYVAFTRARSELIVWCQAPNPAKATPINVDDVEDKDIEGKEDEYVKFTAGVIGAHIANAFVSHRPANIPADLTIDFAAERPKEPDTNVMMEIGHPTVKVLDEKEINEQKEKEARDRNALSVGYDVTIREDVKITALSDSGQEVEDKQPQSDIKDEGTLLHEIMAGVTRPADLPRAVKMIASRHSLSAEKATEYEQLLGSLLADERVKPWFDGFDRVYIEQPIYEPGSPEIVKRPDRVVVYPDGSVDVIDYKFGASEGDHADQCRQVRGYADLLRKMKRYTCVRAYLVYPRQLKIMPVT